MAMCWVAHWVPLRVVRKEKETADSMAFLRAVSLVVSTAGHSASRLVEQMAAPMAETKVLHLAVHLALQKADYWVSNWAVCWDERWAECSVNHWAVMMACTRVE